MKLYHYTTIETLALILRNKTIRFNRLDNVDDIEEGAISPAGVRMGQFVFISCWTKDPEESIPLWKLYTSNGKGVRIGLDSQMFRLYDNSEIATYGNITVNMKGGAWNWTVTPLADMFNKDYLVIPYGYKEQEYFLKDILYVDNVAEAFSNSVFFRQVRPDYEVVTFNTRTLGAYKNKRWSFEKESRFVLMILPGREFKNIHTFDMDFSQCIYDALKKNIPNTITYYDMYLKDNAFDSLEVLLSPNCDEGDKTIIEALCDKYAPKAITAYSCLRDNTRLK